MFEVLIVHSNRWIFPDFKLPAAFPAGSYALTSYTLSGPAAFGWFGAFFISRKTRKSGIHGKVLFMVNNTYEGSLAKSPCAICHLRKFLHRHHSSSQCITSSVDE